VVEVLEAQHPALTVLEPLVEHLITAYLEAPRLRGDALKELVCIDVNPPGGFILAHFLQLIGPGHREGSNQTVQGGGFQ
jgi:hypothetical protein